MKYAAILPFLLCASCSSVRTTDFYVNAKNTQEQDVPCLILVNKKLFKDEQTKASATTPKWIRVPFQMRADGSGYQMMTLEVQPGKQMPDVKIIYDLPEGEVPDYTSDPRIIFPNDAEAQLFFLVRNKTESG